MAKKIQVELEAKTDKAIKEIKDVKGEIQNLTKSTEDGFKDVGDATKGVSKGVKGIKKSDQIINNVKSQLDAVKSDKQLNEKIINELNKRDSIEVEKILPGNADDINVTKIKIK